MKKHSKLHLFLSIAFFVIAPIVLIALSSSTISVDSFSYNETLIKNFCNDTQGSSKNALFCFDDNKKDGYNNKNWSSYSTVYNKDCNALSNLFRTSKDSIELVKSEDIKTNVIFSEFQSKDYSGLDISGKISDFTTDSILISDTVATNLSIDVGDQVSITFDSKAINLTVLAIYQNSEDVKCLNKTYYEFDKPVCFVSSSVFTSACGNAYNIYLNLWNKSDLINSCYRELEPILSVNKALLTVADGFSINDFSIKERTFKEYQTILLKIYQSKDATLGLTLSIIAIAVTLLCAGYIGYGCIEILINNSSLVYKHIVSFNALYAVFNASIAFIAGFILKRCFFTFIKGGYVLFRTIKTPLIVIAAIAIVYVLIMIVSSYVIWKKRKTEVDSKRLEVIKEMKTKNNKIIFVTGSLVRGGAEKVIVELANFYASMGRKVDIVILLHNKVEWDLHENVTVVNFAGDTESRLKRIGYWLKSLKAYFAENKNTTVISFLVRVNLLVLLTAKAENHYLIVSERNDPRFDGRGIIVKGLVDWLYPRADKIVFQTNECKEIFPKNIQEKGVVIPNPIKIKKYAELNNYKPRYFVSAGRICEQKDQITMIRAMAIVTKVFKSAVLEIYGDGDLTDKLNATITKLGLEKNVFIKPSIKEINDVILSSTAYICSSLYEGMSNSLMEASFAGVPCLTTKCLGTDFIKESENGFFFEIGSSKDLADKMMKLLGDEEYYLSIRKNAINVAKELKHDDVYTMWKECIDNE